MKLLTINFLTCAVKSCKSSVSAPSKKPVSAASGEGAEEEYGQLPFPLHIQDATLECTELPYNPQFIRNILPRVNWDALTTIATEVGLKGLLPDSKPKDRSESSTASQLQKEVTSIADTDERQGNEAVQGAVEPMDVDNKEGKERQSPQDQLQDSTLRQLHTLLLETAVSEGKLVCGKCGFEYPIKEGVGNFLLPAHLGQYLLSSVEEPQSCRPLLHSFWKRRHQ
jgi:multifunctional methyltransferase subunit TRM112